MRRQSSCKTFALVGGLTLAGIGMLGASARADAPEVFVSRVPLQPLLDQLKQQGGTLTEIVKPHSLADLLTLQPGARYKFVVRQDGALYVAPLPHDAPNNGYAHTVLALGEPVLTAGLLQTEHDEQMQGITISQESAAFCPSFLSLQAAVKALARLGGDLKVHNKNSPPQCIEVASDPRH